MSVTEENAQDLIVLTKLRELVKLLKHAKPGDRSEKDRWYQIVITDAEKLVGVFSNNIKDGQGVP